MFHHAVIPSFSDTEHTFDAKIESYFPVRWTALDITKTVILKQFDAILYKVQKAFGMTA